MKINLKKRSGMTLVECSAYISIISLLMIIEISLIISMYSNFHNTLKASEDINGISNGIISLNKIVREDVDSRIVYENKKVKVKKKVDGEVENVKEIYLNNGSLIVEYLTIRSNGIIKEGKNVLMVNIDSFNVTKKNNILYLKIESGGEKYIQCI